MVAIYVVSVEEAAGKTAVCAGLARNLINDGKKVGYLKPSAAKDGTDAAFMRQLLGTSDDAPEGKDVVLVECAVGRAAGDAASLEAYSAAREMKAGVIAVVAYPGSPAGYAESYKGFGENLLGVIVNRVPRSQVGNVQAEASAGLGAAGVRLLGVLPEDRVLFAISVGELADTIKGRILNNPDKSAELVENYMLGAMVVDSGLDYFGRKSNKAAVIRQDRPDMQLAALETSTRCLVLTGNSQPPVYSVMEKAENRGIPVISTESNAGDIITGIESALAGGRFGQESKINKAAEIIRQNIDLSAVL